MNLKYNLRTAKKPNGKYYTKLNEEYIGTLTKEELIKVETAIPIYLECGYPMDKIQEILKSEFVNQEKGNAISRGLQDKKVKQYNKKLPISTINRIKEIAKRYGITENEAITHVVNEYSF